MVSFQELVLGSNKSCFPHPLGNVCCLIHICLSVISHAGFRADWLLTRYSILWYTLISHKSHFLSSVCLFSQCTNVLYINL